MMAHLVLYNNCLLTQYHIDHHQSFLNQRFFKKDQRARVAQWVM